MINTKAEIQGRILSSAQIRLPPNKALTFPHFLKYEFFYSKYHLCIKVKPPDQAKGQGGVYVVVISYYEAAD
ncbi:hypothetical protein [Bacillus atrophaeus]|uniref:hypothetical protein n=1 Tax=Bacillus atrophaeus TaxID=1452 RepID=UPI001EFB58C7|nr:hypothetical protein [Bacillus atrophaeus]